jgi:sugar lactone lactonase YvrE
MAGQRAVEYRLARRIGGRGTAPHLFQLALRGIAIDRDRVCAVGDSALKIFGTEGELLGQWATGLPGECVAVDGESRVWVGERQQVEVFHPKNGLVDTWRDPERLGRVTAIGFGKSDLFLADATARCIRRYDATRRFLNDIGDRHRKGGFDIPNGVLDFAIDGEGVLHAANPGMHRVERYSAEGALLGHFGRFDGRDPAGFGGCCNPTNLTVDAHGRVIVSEKAAPRVKAYDPAGELLAVVADVAFDAGAKNMDLAIDSKGRIYVIDTVRLEICVFAPAPPEATA